LSASSSAPATADGFLIVDCLLPGRVQQLGTQATYVTARRALKTTASECAIRGGEYTAADRASAASSIRIWLPLAKAGDVEAQTNLGEIFEKGLGGAQAQPDLAAQWYQLAADQGSARAQINLGALYERGLGVPRDPARAAELYRRASGLSAVQAPYVPVEDVEALRAERDALARDLEAARAERDRLDDELRSLRERLAAERAAVQRGEAALAVARRDLNERTAALEAQAKGGGNADALAAARRELEAQRRAIAARDAEIAQARLAMADLESRAGALQKNLAEAETRRTADVARAEDDARSAREALTALEARLKAAEAERSGGQSRAEAQAAEVRRLRAELAGAQGQAARRAELEAQLASREAELAESRSRIEGLNAQVATLQKDARAARERTASSAARGAEGLEKFSPEQFAFGRFHALIIGNNAYRHLQPLETAVHDARTVDHVLRTRYGFQTTLLIDADRYAILSAMNKLRETLTDKDNLLIYYAGHGELDRVNNRGHWLPVDAETNSSANWISSIQVTDVLNAMNAKQILLVADSCYSGVLTRAAIARLDAAMSDEERLRWLKAMATKKARVVLTSGGVQPVLDGGGGDHSVFAAAFIRTLEENDGILESQRLAQTVVQRVAITAAAASIDQVPVYAPIRFAGHEAGDFFFVARPQVATSGE
jgi:hypothetical protein